MNKIKLKFGILCMSALSTSVLVISVAFSAITKQFPNEPIAKIQMIATIPNLSILIVTLLTGILADKFSKKILVLIGLGIISISGLLPIIIHKNINQLLVLALILGIGVGLVNTISPMLISLFYSPEERPKILGQSVAIVNLGSIVLMLGGGLLGKNNWVDTYWIFLLAVLIFFITIVCLPMDVPKVSTNKTIQNNTYDVFIHLNKLVFLISLIAFFVAIMTNVYPTNLSLVINSKHLGGTSITGMVNAVGTLGGVITGLCMNKISKVLKDKVFVIGFIILGFAFLIVFIFKNLLIILIGAICFGSSVAILMSNIPAFLSLVSQPTEVALAMSLFQFFNSLGGTFAPLFMKWLHINSGKPSYLFGGITCLLISFICLITKIGSRAITSKFEKE